MNPGMMLRIDEYSVKAMKSVISRHVVNDTEALTSFDTPMP